jgi:nucleoside-diphosphate-sugar epimerase
MTALVTGSNGYLGNVLMSRLKGFGIGEVVPMDLGIFSHKLYPYNKLDLRNFNFTSLFSTDIDTVVHLAGVSNDPSCELDYKLTQQMNIDASKRLIDFASISGVRRFIFASSASVYGSNKELVNEEAELNPQSEYARSKIEVENYLLEHKNLNPIIFRFGTLFGYSPKMRYDLAVNLMIKDAIIDGIIKVHGGEQSRPFLHVEDAAIAILKSIGTFTTGIFNLATANVKIQYLAEVIANFENAKIELNQGSTDSRDYKMDCTKSRKELGLVTNSLAYGIAQLDSYIRSIKSTDFTHSDYYTIKAWKNYLEER